MKTFKAKRSGTGLDMRSFTGESGAAYMVFRTQKNAYHVFVEVEAKEAARDCGGPESGTTPQMWDEIWKKSEA
jgi:hypothetical protein